MNKLYLFCTIIFISFFSCASVDKNFKKNVNVPSDIIGVAHAGDPVSEFENAQLDELGIIWVRDDFSWSDVEPQKGVWDFSYYDKMVKENKESGRKILAVLGFDVGWLHKNGKKDYYISEEDLPYFIEYIEKIVTRYKDDVDAWEIWNEPNVSFRFWRGSKKDFFNLTKKTAEKIRECAPNAVITGGVFLWHPASWIVKMQKSGAMENLDGISFHPYGVNPSHTLKIYSNCEKTLRKTGFKGDIWVTEIGYPTNGWYPTRVSEKNFGDYITKTITLLAAKGARIIIWYHLRDSFQEENQQTIDSEKYFGLTYSENGVKKGAMKEGAASFALIAKTIAGSKYIHDWAGKNNYPEKENVFYFQMEDGRGLVIHWNKNKHAKIDIL